MKRKSLHFNNRFCQSRAQSQFGYLLAVWSPNNNDYLGTISLKRSQHDPGLEIVDLPVHIRAGLGVGLELAIASLMRITFDLLLSLSLKRKNTEEYSIFCV